MHDQPSEASVCRTDGLSSPGAGHDAATASALGAGAMARRVLRLVAAAIALGGCGSPAPPPSATPAGRDTNPIIIYLIDTLRADRLGVYGYPQPTSPRLDALAKESVVFEQAYAPAPWTLPSVASILTSSFACEHGLTAAGVALSPALPTLAERLQALGYATGAYYQNASAGPMAALDRGYQISELRQPELGSLAGVAREFIGRTRGPFLLYLHTMEPHNAFDVAERDIRPFGHVSVDDRETYRATGDVHRVAMMADLRKADAAKLAAAEADLERSARELSRMQAQIRILYDAAVRRADTNLGETLDALRESGVLDRALLIVLSDHGEEFGEHGGWFHGQSVYEEMIRVPLLVRFPGGEHAGRRIAARVSLLDLVPTLLDYLGHAEACSGCRGRSLLPLLGAPGTYESPAVTAVRIGWQYYSRRLQARIGDVNIAVREGSRKSIWNAEPDTVELYDLATDPGEQSNRAALEGDAALQARRQGAAWLAECRAQAKPPLDRSGQALDEATRENLRALGYIR